MATLITEPASTDTPRATPAWLAYGTVLLAVLGAYCIVRALRPQPAFPYDDPYITLHSAQVLHTGFDPNYPGVPALFGVTSAPFCGLVSLLLFVLPPLRALEAACWIGLLFYALGLLRLARVLDLRPHLQVIFLFIGLACAPVPVHWFNGLETSCALAAVTWTLSFASGARFRDALATAFLSGLSACVRPDLLPFAVLVTSFVAWRLLRTPPCPPRAWARALILFLVAAFPVVLCASWYFHQTGSAFPLTGVAKRYFFADDHQPLLHRIADEASQIVLFAGAVGPLILVLPRMFRFALGKTLLAVMALFVAALFVQFPNQFAVNELRYPVVLVPALLWGLGMMLVHADPPQRASVQRLMVASALYATAFLPVCYHFYRGERLFFEVGPRQVTTWCDQNLPPRTPILVHDAGYLAYSSGFRIVDFVGLKTPWAIALNRQYTWPTAGRERARVVAIAAVRSGSRILILNSHWPPVKTLPEELRALGWRVDLLHVDGAFRIYRMTPPPTI